MAKDFSPEERLLRLIRSKGRRETPKSEEGIKPNEGISTTASASMPASAPLPKQERPQEALGVPKKVSASRIVNTTLIILLGLLLIYFPFVFKAQKSAIEILEDKTKIQKEKAESPKEEVVRPPFNYFSEQVASKDIFKPIIKEDVPAQAPAQEGPKLEEVKGQLNLLGVVWGEKPQAIIEDKKAQKTYFVNRGETFDDVEVSDIFENKVILIYRGHQFELVL